MSLDNWIKVLGIVGVVISFLWGVWQWKDKSEQELKQRSSEAVRLAETRRLEATKPFLERQLKLYTKPRKSRRRLRRKEARKLERKRGFGSGNSTGANLLWWRIARWRQR